MEKHLKKAKTWNMVLIILGLLSVVSTLAGLPKTLNPKLSHYEVMGSMAQQMFDYVNNPLIKGISVLTLAISIGLLIFFFRANKKLADEIIPAKFPYYLKIGWSLLGSAIGFMLQPKMQMEGMDFTFVTTIVGIVFQIIFLIPAILVIVHLFKAEPEE